MQEKSLLKVNALSDKKDGLRSTDTVYIYTLQSTSKWLWIKAFH